MPRSCSSHLLLLLRGHDYISRAGFVVGASFLGLIVAVFTYEVLLRYFFGAPTRWASDIVSFMLLASVFLVSPWLARGGGHVAVTLLPDMLPRTRASWVYRAGYLIGAAVCVWAGTIGLGELITLAQRGTMTLSSFPIPKWVLTLFICYGLINTGLYFLRLSLAPSDATGKPIGDLDA